jgi:hypothetical protein
VIGSPARNAIERNFLTRLRLKKVIIQTSQKESCTGNAGRSSFSKTNALGTFLKVEINERYQQSTRNTSVLKGRQYLIVDTRAHREN